MRKLTIGFCGMTHLGISTAIGSIARNYETVCLDTDKKIIEDLNNCTLNINEPLLRKVLIKKNKLITFTDNFLLLKKCDLIYISQDIMTNSNGESSLVEIEFLIKKVLNHLRKEQILIILSQVPPGFTRIYLKKFKNIFYQVETLIFGQAFERTMNPERYIIGCEKPENPLPKMFFDFLKSSDCPIIKMKYESAELTKISINMCLISSITIANKMSEICEKLDADWDEIVPALKLDKRIGEHAYIKAQLGISGGNLERDIATAIKISNNNKIKTELFDNFFKISNDRKNWVYKIIRKEVLQKNSFPRFAVLGLSYKKDTNSTKNAPSLVLLPKLKNYSVIAFDPVVDIKKIASWCEKAKSPKEAVKNADVVIILTPWEEIIKLDVNWINRNMKNKYFIDPLNVFDKNEFETKGMKYFSIGKKAKIYNI